MTSFVRTLLLPTAVFAAFMTAPLLWADTAVIDGFKHTNVTFQGLKDGKIELTSSSGRRMSEDFKKVESLDLASVPQVIKAETFVGKKDYKAAASAYFEAVQRINKPALKLIVQARAIKALENDGQWTQAVKNFMEVYKASPTAGTFELRPTNMPDSSSRMLPESANYITTQATNPAFKAPEVQKALKSYLLDIYTQAKDAKAADLAKELAPDQLGPADTATTPKEAALPAAAAPTATASTADTASVEAALSAKKYDEAVRLADSALQNATGDTAIKLFNLKAEALKGAKKPEQAALAYLRIPTHYPASISAASEAMYKAGELLEQVNQKEQAKRIYQEIVTKYERSAWAAAAKAKVNAL